MGMMLHRHFEAERETDAGKVAREASEPKTTATGETMESEQPKRRGRKPKADAAE